MSLEKFLLFYRNFFHMKPLTIALAITLLLSCKSKKDKLFEEINRNTEAIGSYQKSRDFEMRQMDFYSRQGMTNEAIRARKIMGTLQRQIDSLFTLNAKLLDEAAKQ